MTPGSRAALIASLAGGLVMALLLLASGAALQALKIGLLPADVSAYYLGSEEAFANPKTWRGMLETGGPHLAAYALFGLILGHFVSVFAGPPRRGTLAPIVFYYVSAALNVSAGFIVRYAAPGAAWIKPAAFLLFAASAVALPAVAAAGLKARRRAG